METRQFDNEVFQFSIKRNIYPRAAFSDLGTTLQTLAENNKEVSSILNNLSLRKKLLKIDPEDKLIQKLDGKNTNHLKELKIGSFSLVVSAGLSAIYLSLLETLQTSNGDLSSNNIINEKTIKSSTKYVSEIIKNIETTGLEVLKMSITNESFFDRIKEVSKDLGSAYLDGEVTWGGGHCEHCHITIEDDEGNVIDSRCGTKEECKGGGILFLILVGFAIAKWLWDELF